MREDKLLFYYLLFSIVVFLVVLWLSAPWEPDAFSPIKPRRAAPTLSNDAGDIAGDFIDCRDEQPDGHCSMSEQ